MPASSGVEQVAFLAETLKGDLESYLRLPSTACLARPAGRGVNSDEYRMGAFSSALRRGPPI